MTREEAIKNLVAYAYYVDEPMPEEVAKSFDMAIEALQAEYEDYEHATLVDIKELLKVLLVRCKDCKYWHSNTEFCDTWSSMNIAKRTTSDAFCSYGERREP